MTPTNRIEELEAAWLEYADLRGVPHQDEYVDGGETFRKVLPAWERLDRAVKAMKAAPAPEDRIERESTIAELDPLFPATGVDIEYTDGNVAPAAQPSAPADGDVALEEAYQEGYEAGMIEGRDDAISIDKDLFRMLSAWVFEKTGTSWSDFPDGRSPHDLIDMLDEHFRSFKSPSLLAVERGWRTIDSAPKDGRDILLWWRLCKNPSVGRWSIDDAFDQHDEEWPCPEEGWRSDGDQCIPRNQSDCTHWMPLPAAPDTDMGER